MSSISVGPGVLSLIQATNACSTPILEFYDREIALLGSKKPVAGRTGRCEGEHHKSQDDRAAAKSKEIFQLRLYLSCEHC